LAMGNEGYYNPLEQETAEQRDSRMELVRSLQKTFYQDEEGAKVPDLVKEDAEPNTDSSTIQNLPIFVTQSTDFPGSQTVLNVKIPADTNMFQKILKGQSKEWSDYDGDNQSDDMDWSYDGEQPSLDIEKPTTLYFGQISMPGGGENPENPKLTLKKGDVGTLMKIADSRQQRDGQMTLVVQAVEKFEIKRLDRSNPSYATADVTVLPDLEQLLETHPDTWNTTTIVDGDESDVGRNGRIQSAREAAVKYALANHLFEYKDVSIDECATTGECEITNDGETIGMAVSPLSCYDPPRQPLVPNEELDARTLTNSYRDLVAVAESDAWIKLDELLALLISSGTCVEFPVPKQLLALLPVSMSVLVRTGDDAAIVEKTPWPESFRLKGIVREMDDFVVDRDECDMVDDESFCDLFGYTFYYSPLRRAQRLSYAVLTWILNDESTGLAPGMSEMDGISREEILEIESTRERLELATERMGKICLLLT